MDKRNRCWIGKELMPMNNISILLVGTSGRECGHLCITCLLYTKSGRPIYTFKNIYYVTFYLVDSTEGRHIDSLPPDGTCTTNTGGILTGPAVDDGIDQDLEGILEVKVNIVNLFN